METKIEFCFTQEPKRIEPKAHSAPAFRLRELLGHAAMVFVVTGGGPAVGPSGQTCHDKPNIGEMFVSYLRAVFPTTPRKPHLSTVLTAPVKNQRSPLATKVPAHTEASPSAAQTHRLSIPVSDVSPVPCPKEPV
jgi:hypothetical protein